MEIKRILSFALSATITLLATTVRAQSITSEKDKQNTLHLSVGLEAGVPTYAMRYYSSFALGGYAQLQYYVTNRTALMFTSGYTNFFGRHYVDKGGLTINNKDYGIIPVKVGIKEFISPNFYVAGEAGAAFETLDWATEYGNKARLLVLSPSVGYVQSNSGFNVGLRYDSYSGSNNPSYGLAALHVGHGLVF
jgi:hypothetical protein